MKFVINLYIQQQDVPDDMEETVCEPVTVVNPYDGQKFKLGKYY